MCACLLSRRGMDQLENVGPDHVCSRGHCAQLWLSWAAKREFQISLWQGLLAGASGCPIVKAEAGPGLLLLWPRVWGRLISQRCSVNVSAGPSARECLCSQAVARIALPYPPQLLPGSRWQLLCRTGAWSQHLATGLQMYPLSPHLLAGCRARVHDRGILGAAKSDRWAQA